jgi:hypothetical protein
LSVFSPELVTVCFFKTLVSTYESAWSQNPEEHRHSHYHENFMSHRIVLFFLKTDLIELTHNIKDKENNFYLEHILIW